MTIRDTETDIGSSGFIQQAARMLEQITDAEQYVDTISGRETDQPNEACSEPKCQIERLAALLDPLESRLICLAQRLLRICNRFGY